MNIIVSVIGMIGVAILGYLVIVLVKGDKQ